MKGQHKCVLFDQTLPNPAVPKSDTWQMSLKMELLFSIKDALNHQSKVRVIERPYSSLHYVSVTVINHIAKTSEKHLSSDAVQSERRLWGFHRTSMSLSFSLPHLPPSTKNCKDSLSCSKRAVMQHHISTRSFSHNDNISRMNGHHTEV